MAAARTFLATVAVLCIVASEHYYAVADIQCSNAVSRLLPCESFLLFGAPTPTIGCCSSVQALAQIAASSRVDKKAMCECFKSVAKSLPVDFTKAAQLPTLCHVNLDVTISPDVDCDKI